MKHEQHKRGACKGLALIFAGMLVVAGCRVDTPPQEEPGATTSPYLAAQDRSIKALPADRVSGLLAGEGLGYALAAELNHYPGPRHVLDLEDSLSLTAEQRRLVEVAFRRMNDDARAAGAKLVRAEAKLDSLFATGQASEDNIRTAIDEAARHEAQVRYAHLSAHLKTNAALSPSQIAAYLRLRGYAAGESHVHDPMHEM